MFSLPASDPCEPNMTWLQSITFVNETVETRKVRKIQECDDNAQREHSTQSSSD
jgi:hypothetical protein